uniref:Pathogenesis-related protein 1 n=1 Tax=Phalaenopsis aphrodite subsp. formosana TaxID=308872 RepID=J7HBJ3_PHAAO|nr:pathogenesis-related protein 1 [Phalaenopsis aphrodite subsp. formosana]
MAKQMQLWLAAAAMLLAICEAELTTNATEQYLQPHNEARAAVGVAPLQWSRTLASKASTLAAHPPGSSSCDFFNETAYFNYGVNQAVAYVLDSPETVVKLWVEEGRRYYNYACNSCAAPEHKAECESYTQVVWRKTVKLGCGKGGCGKDGSHHICLYYPPGNVPGEKPY